MSLVNVEFPYNFAPDFNRNKAVASGYIYIGEPDLDPEIGANQKTIYFVQEDGNEVVGSQPIRTSAGGVPTYNGSPVAIKTEGDYSIKVLDKNSVQVYYSPNSNVSEALLNALQTVDTLAELPSAASFSGSPRYVTNIGTFVSDGMNWLPNGPILTLEHFVDGVGAGDADADTEAMVAALAYMESVGGGTITGIQGKSYRFNAKSTIDPDTDTTFDFRRSIVYRDAGFTTDDNMFSSGTGTGRITWLLGIVIDEVGVKGTALFNFAGHPYIEFRGARATSYGLLFRAVDCERVVFHDNQLISDEAAPASGSLMAEIKGGTLLENVSVKGCYQKGGRNFIKVETINDGGITQGMDISYNEVEDTYDTAIFCRMTGVDNNIHECATISFNKLYNIGKAGIKYTAPSSAGPGTIANGNVTNNTVKGFGMEVDSPGIIVGDLDVSANIDVFTCTVANNIVDGRNKSGSISTLTGSSANDNRGIKIINITDLVLANNQCWYTPSDGIFISDCTNISGSGNIVRLCCQRSGTNATGGATILRTVEGELGVSVYETQSGLDGVYVDKSEDLYLHGVSNDNANYGVYESNDSGGGLQAGRNVYTFKMLRNGTGPIMQLGQTGANTSKQVNCWDDDGDRHTGTSTRRNAVSASWGGGTESVAGTNRNRGYVFWNQTGDDINVYEQTLWVQYDGSAAAA